MTDRQIDNLIKPATIADTDPASNRVRAQHGGITTDWLPYIVPFAGGVSVWRIPSVG
ncbi:TPA: phage baseplate assembly protein V, partial [Neisseria gonorrhoeae]